MRKIILLSLALFCAAQAAPFTASVGLLGQKGPLTRTSSGLLLQDKFANLSAWTVGTGWSVDTTHPAYVAYPTALNLIDPTAVGGIDGGGIREPHFIQLASGRWYLFYDAGTGLSDATGVWGIKLMYSDNRGISWTRLDSIGIAFTPYASRCMSGWITYYATDGFYYLHVLGADSLTDSPPNVPDLNYHNSIWKASNIEGPWTIINGDDDPALGGSGSFDETTVTVSGVQNISGTWTSVYSARSAGGSYNAGMATASTPAGPYIKDGAGSLMDSSVNGTGTWGATENPKIWFSSTLNKWIIIANEIVLGADRVGIWTASTPTGYRSSSDVQHYSLQRPNISVDGTTTLSVPCPQVDRTGTVQESAEGNIAYVFAGSPSDPSHQAIKQRIKQGVLEASSNAMSLALGSGTVDISRASVGDDFVAEWVHEMENTEGTADFCYRLTGLTTGSGTCYAIDINENTASATLYRQVSGSFTSLASGSLPARPFNPNGHNTVSQRYKMVVVGNIHTLYVGSDQILTYTDGSPITTGPLIAFRGDVSSGSAGVQRVRLLTLRKTDTIIVNNCPFGSRVVLRGDGGVAAAVVIVGASGTATLTHYHYPMKSIEVNGVDYPFSGGVWGGDVFTF